MENITLTASGIMDILAKMAIMIVTGFLIPWIKKRMEDEKFSRVKEMVRCLVEAAETMYKGSGHGKLKKQFVHDYLDSNDIEHEDKMLDILIESEVCHLS